MLEQVEKFMDGELKGQPAIDMIKEMSRDNGMLQKMQSHGISRTPDKFIRDLKRVSREHQKEIIVKIKTK